MKLKAMLLVLLALGIAFAGLSVNNFTVSKETFNQNDPGAITVSVTNPVGAERVSSVTMDIDAPYEIVLTGTPSLADISSGGSTIVTVPFKVRDGAKAGIYLVTLTFRGYTEVETQAKLSINTVSIPVVVADQPEFSVSIGKQLLTSTDAVNFTLENDGGVARNLRVKLPGNISLYGLSQIYVGEVRDTATFGAILDSRDVTEGPADLVVTLLYDDELGIPHEENKTVRVTVRPEALDLAIAQLSELVTKKEGTLALSITNLGTETLKDVRLKFSNGTVRLKDENELKFGDLGPGETALANATVFADLPPGVNLVDAGLSWIERDVRKEEERKVPITMTSDADVGVYLEARPLPLTAGQDHTISVLVSNLGSYRIENVDVSLSSPALRSVDISEKQYIGGLSNDDFSTVQFQMRVNATGEGEYPVRITVNYRDQSGEWRQKTITQDVSVYNAPAQEGSMLPLIAGAAVLAALVWWFRFRKK
ncbi:MAG: hypothetical protein AB1529_04160 [Candidatus Micrarchaeota archaeon]